ncbi:MAG: hypothetical protein JO202_16275 [Ktedonobacteraceae bacterium]|nr:hypothetical protein [Ktedonobacteraceae bacterium]
MSIFSAMINGIEHVADDFGKLLDTALKELESLGIGTFEGLEGFVHFLLEMGQDPVHVISSMIGHIEHIGGSVIPTMEEIALGVVNQGLTGFATAKLNQVVEPVRGALQQQNRVGMQVADVHKTTMSVMQTRLTSLTTAQASGVTWQGPGATEMNTQFTSLSNSLTQLNLNIDAGGAQQSLNNACLLVLEGIGVLAAGLAILDILLIVVEAVVAVATGGTAVLVEAPLDAALLAAQIDLILSLVAADLIIWIVGTLAIYAYNHLVHTVTSTPEASKPQILHLNLPKGPQITPEQQAAVEDMVRELAAKLGVNAEALQKWLQLIAQALGAGVSAEELKRIIRCLEAKGYLDASLKSAWNSVADHLTPRDLQGAWGDHNGYDTSADHWGEVNGSLASLSKLIGDLNKKIADYSISAAKRAFYQGLRDSAQKTIDYVTKLITGGKNQGPSTKYWDDPKGQVPFAQDVIQASGCV